VTDPAFYRLVTASRRYTEGMRLGALLLIAGCHASIAPGQPDAAPVDSTASCASQRPVFVALDGVMLVQAAASDATMNQAEWLPVQMAMVPAYRASSVNRAAQIQQLLAALAGPFPDLPIVTARPAGGSFVLLAVGGSGADLGFVGTTNAATHLDCGDANPNDVVWVSEALAAQETADLAIGAIGVAIGLTGTMNSDDCMCGFGNSCASNPTACTLGTLPADARCPGQAQPQDESAGFARAFCD
jgi:hypothetical protein